MKGHTYTHIYTHKMAANAPIRQNMNVTTNTAQHNTTQHHYTNTK